MPDIFDETSTNTKEKQKDITIETLPKPVITKEHTDKTEMISNTYGTNSVIHLGGSYVAYVNVDKNIVIIRHMATDRLIKLTF